MPAHRNGPVSSNVMRLSGLAYLPKSKMSATYGNFRENSAMLKIHRTVFISYRRTNVSWALTIYKALLASGFDVFFDYEGIANGDFEHSIKENIVARAHFLVLLAPGALDRCNEHDDWLCKEISVAIGTRRNIVPILLDNFSFTPDVLKNLPPSISTLSKYNAIKIVPDYFDAAIEKLDKKFLSAPLQSVVHPASKSAEAVVVSQKKAANAAAKVSNSDLEYSQLVVKINSELSDAKLLILLDAAILLRPTKAELWSTRATVKNRLGKVEEAVKDCAKAIKLAPNSARGWGNRGIILANAAIAGSRDSEQLAAALRDLQTALKLEPDNPEYLKAAVEIQRLQGSLSAAIESLSRLIHIESKNSKHRRLRAWLHARNQNTAAAREDLDAAIKMDPKFALAYSNRAELLCDIDPDAAFKDFSKAIQLSPNDPLYYEQRTKYWESVGNWDAALLDYNKAIALSPSNPERYYSRSTHWERKGDFKAALADMETFVQLGGNNSDAAERIAYFRKRASLFGRLFMT